MISHSLRIPSSFKIKEYNNMSFSPYLVKDQVSFFYFPCENVEELRREIKKENDMAKSICIFSDKNRSKQRHNCEYLKYALSFSLLSHFWSSAESSWGLILRFLGDWKPRAILADKSLQTPALYGFVCCLKVPCWDFFFFLIAHVYITKNRKRDYR